jgi:Trk K+ transport system NAD-binding subunit
MLELHDAARIGEWRDHVVLCGLGRIGTQVAETLLRAGSSLVVIDNGPITPFRRALDQLGVTVIVGDSTQPEILLLAGVRQAAVVVVTISHDMPSLKTALAAREMNPAARVVMRLFNLRMAEHLSNLPAAIEALSVSSIVAPVFALAARNRRLAGAFYLAETSWAIGTIEAPDASSTPSRTEDWRRAGVVVLAATTGDTTVWFPPPSWVPAPRSRLLVATSPARLQALGEHSEVLRAALAEPDPVVWLDAQSAPDAAGVQPRRAFVWRAWRLWKRANRFLRIALLAQLSLLAFSVVIFHVFFPLSLVDAVYFTGALITTVGLGDINLLSAAAPLKLYGVFVMLCGAVLMAIIYALVAEYVVSQRLDALIGGSLDDLTDHYVVAGLGAVGFRVASTLHEAGHRVVAIDHSDQARFAPQLRALGVPLVVGDTVFEDTLHRARIADARAFIAATSNDLVNIEAALNARALQPDMHVVLRVFDHELAVQARHSLGIPASFSSPEIAAPVFARAAIGHDAPQVLSIPVDHPGAEGIALIHLRADADPSLIGQSLADIATARGGAPILHRPAGVERDARFAPASATLMGAEDVLVLAIAGQAQYAGEFASRP